MKELLVVIDYQNDFVNGALGFEGAEKLDGPIVEKIREYRRRGAGSMELAKAAMENNYEKIELVGLVSNICVLTNAAVLKTALPEAEITVDAACTASFDPKANTEALDSMESIQINVINRKDD